MLPRIIFFIIPLISCWWSQMCATIFFFPFLAEQFSCSAGRKCRTCKLWLSGVLQTGSYGMTRWSRNWVIGYFSRVKCDAGSPKLLWTAPVVDEVDLLCCGIVVFFCLHWYPSFYVFLCVFDGCLTDFYNKIVPSYGIFGPEALNLYNTGCSITNNTSAFLNSI